MITLEKIKEPVAGEISRYESYLKESLHSDNSLAQTMLDHIFDHRGKAVRPLMVILSAAMYSRGAPLSDDSHLAAMLLEMIHTASLVHDDVIDEAFIRRGRPSVNALWRSPRAVLIGDYILAKSYGVGLASGAYELVAYITRTMADICEGELAQSDQTDKLTMTREIYSEIIYKKTATLLGTSCGAGALSVGAPPAEIEKMKRIGDAIGMAFQIRDDILDYMPVATTGKPTCGDLRERKITLPLLTVLEKSTPSERRKIIRLLSGIRSHPANADRLHDIVTSENGLEMASAIGEGYISEARALLESCPPSPYRDSLDLLCTYVCTRKM